MENTAPSMPIDVEKKAAPVVQRKPIHASFNNRATRWAMKLEIQVALSMFILCMTAPLAIFALSIHGFRPPLAAPRFEMLLSGSYVLNVLTLMLNWHCKTVLDECNGKFVGSKHRITWRLSLHAIYEEMWTRFQFLYVSWTVHYATFLCVLCLGLTFVGWIDLVWQLYRTAAFAAIGTCACLVLIQSALASLPTSLSEHFFFRRPIIGLIFKTIKRVCSGAWSPNSLWLWEQSKQNRREMERLNRELADWVVGRSILDQCRTDKEIEAYNKLRQIAFANRSA